MQRYLYFISVLLLVILWSSCRKDFEYAANVGNLEFSKDTVFLDTIFTNIGSSTYTLKVYNPNRDDIEIPTIGLEQGQNSKYRLNVDGVAGKEFRNIPILAQDSLFIFIETTYDQSASIDNKFLYTDVIIFDSGINQQEVPLITLVKDAVFLYPRTQADGTKETILLGLDVNGEEIHAEGFYLDETELEFNNEKPYVIYGFAAVKEGETINIAAGSRLHFHKNSGIYVSDGASISINGSLSNDRDILENEVIFEGDRLEPEFSNIPGQWGLLWIASGSNSNNIEYLTLKNATTGVFVEGDEQLLSPTLNIRNTQIYNSANTNLWAKNAFIVAENVILGGAGNNSLHCNLGGNYTFTHSTIANYWIHGFRTGTALRIDNHDPNEVGELTKANFYNCIVDGNNTRELSLQDNGVNPFNFQFDHSIIKYNDAPGQTNNNPLYDFDDTLLYKQVFLNEDVDFSDVTKNIFWIGESSFAKDKGEQENALLVPFDILGTDRTILPDIGAYELPLQN
ncbi:hypothetical protein [Maribacter sp. HTCC2170]|uniref:hypothetical protein n=1 Tax=Maribacter sp. (strain HTCC2170 / KCCM 42371) TaxID=313603 RepID=UPI00006B2263|nr:hypothetical protein [Maribacter sp. HTCC2170]EAR00380.1 hypothetical protein FB2170_13201 [Maribacter sp. HTCC2170]